MSPPSYANLGGSARDIFSRGYHFNKYHIDLRTKTNAGLQINSGGSADYETGKATGNVETKYKVEELGLTLSGRWSTDNTVVTATTGNVEAKYKVEELGLTLRGRWSTDNTIVTAVSSGQFLKGVKLTANCSLSPKTRFASSRIQGEYKHDLVTINSDMRLTEKDATVNGSAVLGYQNWVLGYNTEFNSSTNKITKNNFAFGYLGSDFTWHTSVKDGQKFNGSIHQKLSKQLETGIQLDWSASNEDTRFGIGCKYALADSTCFRAKVDNKSQVGLSYQHTVDDITFNVSAVIDGQSGGQRKFGFSLEFNP